MTGIYATLTAMTTLRPLSGAYLDLNCFSRLRVDGVKEEAGRGGGEGLAIRGRKGKGECRG